MKLRPTHAEFRAFAAQIESVEQFAYKVGLLETAKALNTAKNKSGWEFAYLLKKHGSTPSGGEKP